MKSIALPAALASALLCAAYHTAIAADEWWMLRKTEQGPECGPPLETAWC